MKRKKGLILALVAVAVLGTIIMGCAEEVAPEEVAPEEVAPAEPGEVYEWTHLHSCTYAAVPILGDFMFELERRSQGRIKLKFLGWGEFPYSYEDLYPALSRGECDSAYISSFIMDACDPRFGIVELPLLLNDVDAVYDLGTNPKYESLFRRVFLDPLDEWNTMLLTFYPYCGYGFGMRDVFVDSIDALKGKQVRSTGWARSKGVELFGGTPVPLEFGEVSSALERGILDGVCTDWDSMYLSGFADELKCYTFCQYHAGLNLNIMNKDSLARLPDDLKAMVLDYSKEYNAKYARRDAYFAEGKAIINGAEDYGVQFRAIPPDVLAQARKKAEVLWWERVKDIPDGEENLNSLIEFFDEWKSEHVIIPTVAG